MRKHDLQLNRRQNWCVSTDPEFSRKASEIVGLYLNPPENAFSGATSRLNYRRRCQLVPLPATPGEESFWHTV